MSIKISDINNQANTNRLVSTDSNKTNKVFNKHFSSQLKELRGQSATEKLNNLLSDIDKQGQKLGSKLYIGDLVKYKKLVKEFLDTAVKNAYEFSKESFLDRRGRHRVFSMVKSIDKELESLTKQFLQEEKDSIKILKKIDDIRGMLIDIFL